MKSSGASSEMMRDVMGDLCFQVPFMRHPEDAPDLPPASSGESEVGCSDAAMQRCCLALTLSDPGHWCHCQEDEKKKESKEGKEGKKGKKKSSKARH